MVCQVAGPASPLRAVAGTSVQSIVPKGMSRVMPVPLLMVVERIDKAGHPDRLLFHISLHPNGQRMPEHVPRVVARLDPLQARVVVPVVERMPRDAGRVLRRVSEIRVGVIDESAVVRVARYRHAAAVGEELAV